MEDKLGMSLEDLVKTTQVSRRERKEKTVVEKGDEGEGAGASAGLGRTRRGRKRRIMKLRSEKRVEPKAKAKARAKASRRVARRPLGRMDEHDWRGDERELPLGRGGWGLGSAWGPAWETRRPMSGPGGGLYAEWPDGRFPGSGPLRPSIITKRRAAELPVPEPKRMRLDRDEWGGRWDGPWGGAPPPQRGSFGFADPFGDTDRWVGRGDRLGLGGLDGLSLRGEAMVTAREPSIGTRIRVANVPRNLDTRDVKEAFEDVGTVVQCKVERGVAYVTFRSALVAKKAVQTFDRGELNGQTIYVTLD